MRTPAFASARRGAPRRNNHYSRNPAGDRMARVLFMILFFALAPKIAAADPAGCRNAAEEVESAQSEIASALSTYSSCVASTDGRDDCSSEFSSLQSSHSDLESAVSDFESEC